MTGGAKGLDSVLTQRCYCQEIHAIPNHEFQKACRLVAFPCVFDRTRPCHHKFWGRESFAILCDMNPALSAAKVGEVLIIELNLPYTFL